MVTLVLGGARSGKSEVAERLAGAAGDPVTYLATGWAGDGDVDMQARIDAHRRRRPPGWTTVETGPDLVAALRGTEGTVLVDSLGTWVARHEDFEVPTAELCAALSGRPGATVVVSEEVGLGVHPSSEAGRLFRDALGQVNRAVADLAGEVLLVVAGRVLPLTAPGPDGRP